MSSPTIPPAPTPELTSADQDQLVELLERCHQLIEPRRRSALIERLPAQIQRKVRHPDGLRAALSELVRVCNDHDGGVAALGRALRWFEGDSRPMQEVEAFCAARGVLVSQPAHAEPADAQSASDEPAPDEPDHTGSLPAYAAWAWKQFKHLQLLGLGGGEFELGLDEVHVPLMFSPNVYGYGWRDLGGEHGRRGALRSADASSQAGSNENTALAADTHEAAQFGPDALGRMAPGMGGKVALHRAFALAGDCQHLFIRGEPGSGKSTALKKLLWSLLRGGADVDAEAGTGTDTDTNVDTTGPRFDGRAVGLARGTVGVFLRLRDLAGPLLACDPADMLDRALIRATATDRAGHAAVSEGFGRWLWRRGHLVLLLDGLDEIARSADREKLCRRLEALAEAARPQNIRLVVSSRFAGIEEQGAVNLAHDRFLHLDVQPLSDDQSAQLVERWYRAAGRARARMRREPAALGEERAARRAAELIGAMQRHKSAKIKQFVSTPMLLTLLCLLFERGGRIPERRVEFFRICLDTLLDSWVEERLDDGSRLLSREEALDMLEPVAWALHVGQRRYDLAERELRQLLERPIQRLQGQGRRKPMVTFQTARDWLVRVTGVLSEYAPGEYGFMHLNLQEYLAATYAARAAARPGRGFGASAGVPGVGRARRASERADEHPLDVLVESFGDEWWREVVLLAVGLREHDLFAPLMTRVLADARHLEVAAAHIDECLHEAYHHDLTPFIDVICDDGQSLARRLAALRLVRNHADEALIEAASALAVELAGQQEQGAAPEAEQLQVLAELIEANAPAISDDEAPVRDRDGSGSAALAATVGPVWLVCAGEDEPVAQRMARVMSNWGWPVQVCTGDAERAEQPEFVEHLTQAGAVVAVAGPEGRGPWRALAGRRALLALVRRGYSRLVVGLLADASSQASPAFLRTAVHVGADVMDGEIGNLAASPLVAKLAALLDVTVPDVVVTRSIEATEPPETQREPERGTAHIAESVGMRFLWLPGGTFMMGSSDDDDMAYGDEKPAHPVTVSGLWMSETPVTNRAYGELLKSAKLIEPEYWRNRSFNQLDQPVVGVSWYEAARFCNALSEIEELEPCYQLFGYRHAPTVAWQRKADGYRLPTEAEWEHACRAGTTTRWWFGNNIDQLPDYAWYYKSSDGGLKSVAGRPPNPWGLYDMHGNTWEWCWNWFAKYPNPAPLAPLRHSTRANETETPTVNLSNAEIKNLMHQLRRSLARSNVDTFNAEFRDITAKSRTLRGGAFSNGAQDLRSAIRGRLAPKYRNKNIGFRCVRGAHAQKLDI